MIHDGWMLQVMVEAAKTGLLISLPLLLTALASGIVFGVIQVATQISDMSLGFVPKMLLVVLVAWLAGRWMSHVAVAYLQHAIASVPHDMGVH